MKPIIILLRQAAIWGASLGAVVFILVLLFAAFLGWHLNPVGLLWPLIWLMLVGTAIMAVVMIIAVVAKRLFGGN